MKTIPGETPADGQPERAYPLEQPADDPRFNFGLVYDVARVLESAGYPPIRAGGDLTELVVALRRFIYGPVVFP